MATLSAATAKKLFPKVKRIQVTPEHISKNLNELEEKIVEVELADQIPARDKFYLLDAKKMLLFARENYAKGFFHVSDASLLLARRYLELCKLIEN